jgi:hypothetical protein
MKPRRTQSQGRQRDIEADRQTEKETVNYGVIWIQTVKLRILHHGSSRITREGYHWSLLTETTRSLTKQTV